MSIVKALPSDNHDPDPVNMFRDRDLALHARVIYSAAVPTLTLMRLRALCRFQPLLNGFLAMITLDNVIRGPTFKQVQELLVVIAGIERQKQRKLGNATCQRYTLVEILPRTRCIRMLTSIAQFTVEHEAARTNITEHGCVSVALFVRPLDAFLLQVGIIQNRHIAINDCIRLPINGNRLLIAGVILPGFLGDVERASDNSAVEFPQNGCQISGRDSIRYRKMELDGTFSTPIRRLKFLSFRYSSIAS
jgi:hypothetical protein